MFRSLSIRTKLIGAFTLVVVCVLSLGFVGIQGLRSLNPIIDELSDKRLPSVRWAGAISDAANAIQSGTLAHILTNEEKAKQGIETNIERYKERLAEARGKYEKLISEPAERALYETFGRDWAAFAVEFQKVFELSKANKDEEARTYNSQKARPYYLKASEDLTKLIELNVKAADDANLTSDVAYASAINLAIGGMAGSTLLMILLAFFNVRSITRGIASVTKPMGELAAGNLSIEIPNRGEKTEIGAIADAVQIFKQGLIERRDLETAAKETEIRAAAQRKADMNALATKFEGTVGNIIDTVSSSTTELEATAVTLTRTAETTQRLTATASRASNDASQNVQTVASATEELSSSVNEIARQVQESSRIATEAVQQAARTDQRMNELSAAAQRIGDVVKLITAVAEQTNLLALNATIEAARAGEAGRGFAVVASEVKALASQTAKATDEISAQISSMQNAANDSVTAIKEIGGTIGRISEIASLIASAVEEQGSATQEIARNVQQAAQGTTQLAGNLGDVDRGASETGSASTQVLASAKSLANEGGRLKLEVGRFLDTVRAA
jgi:methyl-accepting chemotaxis protein